MGLATNIWDGVTYLGRFISGTSIFNESGTVYYIVPLVTGHNYRLVMTEVSNRLRVLTTTTSPETASSGLRSLIETTSPYVGQTLDFTAQTNENYVMIYVSNISESPDIAVYDLSAPDYIKKYLIEDAGLFYTISESTLSMVSVSSPPTAAEFQSVGFDDLSEISLVTTLEAPKILKWNNGDSSLPFSIHLTATPTTPRYIFDTVDMSNEAITAIESFKQTSSGNIAIAFSIDQTNWYSYIGGEWIDASTEMAIALVGNLTNAIMLELLGTAEIFYIRIGLFADAVLQDFTIFFNDLE